MQPLGVYCFRILWSQLKMKVCFDVQGRGSGVNFALPADLVLDIVPKLIVYGNPSGKGLG